MNAAREFWPVSSSVATLALTVFAPWAACVAAAADAPAAGGSPVQPAPAPIQAIELSERPVIGDLGHPLGKIVTIEGVVADGDFTRKKADVGGTLLRIQSVDGKPLQSEVIYHFAPSSLVKIAKPTVGSRFKYRGYETGEFSGSPAGEFQFTGPYATTSFHFSMRFEVLKDERPRP